jgi:hypothetical protein
LKPRRFKEIYMVIYTLSKTDRNKYKMRLLEDETRLIHLPVTQSLDHTHTQIKENVPTEKKKLQCSGCKKHVEKLYQQNLCKTCLSITFKRLIKVIDSVRK